LALKPNQAAEDEAGEKRQYEREAAMKIKLRRSTSLVNSVCGVSSISEE